jgi:Heat induced stress protein YflT
MADKKYIGLFRTEQEVLNKIKELKSEGYVEDDIYVVTNDQDSLSIVRGQTDVDLLSVDGNWLDKFLAFISGDEPVRAAFHDMGYTDEESERFYSEVKNGSILLYVDKDYATIYDYGQIDLGTGYTGTKIASSDPFNSRTDGIPNASNSTLENKALDNDPLEENRLNKDPLNRNKKF